MAWKPPQREARHFGPKKPKPQPKKQRARFTPVMEERLRTMAAQGQPATAIAKALQLLAPLMSITADTVRRKASCLGLRLKHGRHKSCRVDFELTIDTLETTRRVAYARGMSIRQFARLMVETVVRNGLVDAILSPPTRPPVEPGKLGGRPRSRKAPADAHVEA